jgi:aryl-alcohol dehydrogenase-like predicted oxidoreductase
VVVGTKPGLRADPGFKSVAQVEENAGALRLMPLDDQQMSEIAGLLD